MFNGLLDYDIVEDFVVPPLYVLEYILNPPPIEWNANDDVSVGSKLSEYFSESAPVNENIKQYLMKGGTCDIRSCNSKAFDFGTDTLSLTPTLSQI